MKKLFKSERLLVVITIALLCMAVYAAAVGNVLSVAVNAGVCANFAMHLGNVRGKAEQAEKLAAVQARHDRLEHAARRGLSIISSHQVNEKQLDVILREALDGYYPGERQA